MGVLVTKEEFNLRSKLNELNFSTIPVEKMPAGSIIQTKHNYVTAQTVFGATTSAAELFGVDIYPKVKSSSMLVTARISFSHDRLAYDNADHGDHFLFLRNNDVYFGVNSNLTRSFGYTNNNAFYKTDVPFSNDAVQHSWAYDVWERSIQCMHDDWSADNTGKVRYSIEMMCQNNFELNRAQQNTGNGAVSWITVKEIKT